MKQFNVVQQVFDDCVLNENGEPILNGENWYFVADQETINQISASVTGGGVVWVDNGVIKASGATPSPFHIWQNGKWKLDKSAQQAEFQAAKDDKIAALNQSAQLFVNQVTGADKLPEFEKDTWTIQAQEAKAWFVDKNAHTPILDGIAVARGILPNLLKQKALEKAQKHEQVVAMMVGQRQAMQMRIETAKNLDELNAIEIAFRLPETGESTL